MFLVWFKLTFWWINSCGGINSAGVYVCAYVCAWVCVYVYVCASVCVCKQLTSKYCAFPWFQGQRRPWPVSKIRWVAILCCWKTWNLHRLHVQNHNRIKTCSFVYWRRFTHCKSKTHKWNWGGVAWRGVAWRGVAWRGVAWRGVAWRGVAWRGVAWRGVAWPNVSCRVNENISFVYHPV